MLVVTIKFLNGTYHATPWGNHVNEGTVEWPPSLWRLMRGIISAWKSTKPELRDSEIWPILQKMISEHPKYHLPGARVSHTRHYMPINDLKKETTLVMDAFVLTDKPVAIIWDSVTLNPDELGILESVLKNMHYLGRAESWCTVGVSATPHTYNCYPIEEQAQLEDVELVRTLVPAKDAVLLDTANLKSKPTTNELKAITITTQNLQECNYIDPPGGEWIYYARPQNCFEEKPSEGPASLDNATVVRYAIVGATRPSIKDTLRVGDLARSACVSRYGKKTNGNRSATFSGKRQDGTPLRDHMHALYLPTYETQAHKLDHLTIIAKGSFNSIERSVLHSLGLYSYNMRVNLLFQGLGTLGDFSDIPILQKSSKWESATPLVLTRHIKYRGRGSNKRMVDSPEEQIRGEIKRRYGHDVKSITVDSSNPVMRNTNTRPVDFFRWRGHGRIGDGRAYKVDLEFRERVGGPIALGYASHFGLGMFTPVEE